MAENRSLIHANISIPFPTERQATIAYDVLRVDDEPKRSAVTKIIEVEKNILKVNFAAPEVRQLRVGVTSFMNHLVLVTETMDQFGPPQTDKYSYN